MTDRFRTGAGRRVACTGVAGIVAALMVAGVSASAQTISPGGVEFLQRTKAFIYNGLTQISAEGVAAGTTDPFVQIAPGAGTLPVAYYHFPVLAEQRDAFRAALRLPTGLELVPVRVVSGAEPGHFLTVAVYEAGGERAGLRAEWTTYVRGPGDARPRTLMLDATMDRAFVDPVRIHAPAAGRFVYSREGQTLRTEIVAGATTFASTVPLPTGSRGSRLLDRQWGAAGDVVYWRNGVADVQTFNGLVANRPVLSIPPDGVAVAQQSPWTPFIAARPAWDVLVDQRIDVVVRPWVNADDPAVALDPPFRADLLATKAAYFSEIERQRAVAIGQRKAEPLMDFLLETAPPAIFLNYRIRPERRAALAAAIPLPAGFRLAPVQPHPGVPKDYYLSLNIYNAAGLAPGLRAEWSVYVTRNGESTPRFMIIDVQTSEVSVDPLNLITIPAERFTYNTTGNTLAIDLSAPGVSFAAWLQVPEAPQMREMNLDWAECNNLVYWRNGVADKIYYDESAYGPVAVVPRRNVVQRDGTRWAPFVELDHVFLYEKSQGLVASPWSNLSTLQPPVARPRPAMAKERPAGAQRARVAR